MGALRFYVERRAPSVRSCCHDSGGGGERSRDPRDPSDSELSRLTIAVLIARCPVRTVHGGKLKTYLERWTELFQDNSPEISRFERTPKFRAAVDWLESELKRRFE
jgi:hypothetical protein